MSNAASTIAVADYPATQPQIVVHKFGGSSVQDTAAIRQVVSIVAGEPAAQVYVVVSAARGTTDSLLDFIGSAARRDNWQAALSSIRRRQTTLIRATLGSIPVADVLCETLRSDMAALRELARATALLGTVTVETRDAVAAHGELWSMRLLCSALQARGISAVSLDARRFLRVRHTQDTLAVDWQASLQRLTACTQHQLAPVFVVPGFIAGRDEAVTLTLGRNGSDWSATILARLVGAEHVTIWSDVPGVLDADPRVVADARPREMLRNADAQALAEHGARILHPATLAPLLGQNIRLAVRCTFTPEQPGTLINDDARDTGITIAARPVDENTGTTAVSALGETALAGPALAALANARITPQEFTAAPGQTRIVLNAAHAERAQRIWHRALCRKQHSAALLVLGTGQVGRALLHQLETWRANDRAHDTIRLLGVANSRHCHLHSAGIEPGTVLRKSRKLHDGPAPALDSLQNFLLTHCEGAPIIVDATASTDVADWHARWLAAGIHVVTANKLAAAQGDVYRAASSSVYYGDSATVGAGLPVLSSLRRLHNAGDNIVDIEGILSGSLAYMFHALQRKNAFSQALAIAVRKGYTEPDPRMDLSGTDVARKLSIIARAGGIILPDAPQPEPVLPESVLRLPNAEFQASLADYNAYWRDRCIAAQQKNRVLRYVARVTAEGGASVRVEACKQESHLAHGGSTENTIIIRSGVYRKSPLVIHGPGAGPALTAQALLADIGEILDRHG